MKLHPDTLKRLRNKSIFNFNEEQIAIIDKYLSLYEMDTERWAGAPHELLTAHVIAAAIEFFRGIKITKEDLATLIQNPTNNTG